MKTSEAAPASSIASHRTKAWTHAPIARLAKPGDIDSEALTPVHRA